MRTKTPRKRKRRPETATKLTAKLIRIGNSRGVRLPKAVIEQAKLGDEVELTVQGTEVVLSAATKQPRAGWDEAFKKALARLGPDALERERAEWAQWQSMS